MRSRRVIWSVAAAVILVTSCSSGGGGLTLDSTCVDYLDADEETQREAVRTLGSDAGWEGATLGRATDRVWTSCNSPDRDPGDTTLQRLFNIYADMESSG